MATLSRSDVEHVAHLARLGLSDDELTRLEGQLNHIVDQYAVLARLDTEHIPPTAQTIELENILRDDVVRESLPVEAAVGNAAEREDGFVVVPRIIGDPTADSTAQPETGSRADRDGGEDAPGR
jgi:aspartyl-tRNA(Asn)/glutamyl-tRNA(Gln) amidotransferase subunit C